MDAEAKDESSTWSARCFCGFVVFGMWWKAEAGEHADEFFHVVDCFDGGVYVTGIAPDVPFKVRIPKG